jgi:hypothetical protein
VCWWSVNSAIVTLSLNVVIPSGAAQVNPLYHVYAMNTTTLNLMVAGGTAITLPAFKAHGSGL